MASPFAYSVTTVSIWAVFVISGTCGYSSFKDSQVLDKGLNNAEFINVNGVPNHNSIGSFSGNLQATSSGGGVPSFAGTTTDDRTVLETFTMALLRHTYYDMDDVLRVLGDGTAKYGEGKIFPVHGRLVHVTSGKDINDHSACNANIRGTLGQR